ncbi:TrkH family potassium uptake protein [Treponema parvum]|uniref:TrkH family potassium uptake protein n=1 Tax=Treponema parvum TaxID=138851 RepID=A0A975EYG3_9SPIR|nr:TrkH family potassium uptake protein [Treponema parvum]QTQ11017.1 TrkH family potassium uptake protein [Treponema parvum]QTQ17038.1 TrkH family potassium uptake protein [Treponema parvum]
MTIKIFLRIIFVLLAIVGLSFLMPIFVALAYKEYEIVPVFLIPMIIVVILGIISVVLGRGEQLSLSTRGAFVIAACSWIFASLLGAVPLMASGCIPRLADAVFESVSGFTTTGGTILENVDDLPKSINLWRCLMHWLGGMGIVALTVAFLPLLGVGGFQLIKAETTGPEKGKVTPKITNTAKALWIIYVVLTAIQTMLLMAAGLDFVNSASIAFATLGTGGFALKNASIGGYNSAAVDWICTVFMFLSGINFTMYFYAVSRKFKDIRENTELKAYATVFIISSLAVAVFIKPQFGSFINSLRHAAFNVASIISTTGFATADYTLWVPPAQFVIFLLYFLGACSGSTAGGVKIIRWVILAKQGSNEILRMLHPHGIFTIHLNGKPGRRDVVFNVAAFIYFYFLLIFVTTFVGTLGNVGILSSFTGALAMLGNVGPAFGKFGPSYNYGFLPDFVKWWYSFAMLAGRLELYTMIIYFTKSYWKK